jgi:hypothetical protein
MTGNLDRMQGMRVRSCAAEAGALMLDFLSSQIVIHNKWKVVDAVGEPLEYSTLRGAIFLDSVTSDTEIRFEFDRAQLRVDLSDGSWSGPEAAVLYVDGVPRVIWP